ncbi:MAG: GIY-YIG nuclease family protein [bacterium]
MNYNKKTFSCIYRIRNLKNNKVYVGSAVDFYHRCSQHKCDLSLNQHFNKYLQHAWNKYGGENFVFEVIEKVKNKKNLIKREQYWMDKFKSYDFKFGYNFVKIAGSQLGFKHSKETRVKMGHVITKKHRKILRLVRLGKKLSKKIKDKMSKSHKGITTWNKGKSGYKIKPQSQKVKTFLRKCMLKRTHSVGYVHPMTDRKHTQKTLDKIRHTLFKKGFTPWNKGKKIGPHKKRKI